MDADIKRDLSMIHDALKGFEHGAALAAFERVANALMTRAECYVMQARENAKLVFEELEDLRDRVVAAPANEELEEGLMRRALTAGRALRDVDAWLADRKVEGSDRALILAMRYELRAHGAWLEVEGLPGLRPISGGYHPMTGRKLAGA